jgi:aminomethyltransferase
MPAPKQTLLYQTHLASGGRMVDFAGWSMPVQYHGILDEHRAVRDRCGVFDISHMGEFFVRGPEARRWLNGLLTNDLGALETGRGQYSLLLNEQGGVIDDLIVYQAQEDEFFLVVNAAKIVEDADWLNRHLPETGVEFLDESDEMVALAVQGPGAPEVFSKVFGGAILPERNHLLAFSEKFGHGYVGVTGYTGEAGFEIFLRTKQSEEAKALWQMFLDAGASPCGLGARDTLRLEMCYPLNGSDLSPDRTPLEAGLGVFVSWNKGDFIGRDALLRQKQTGVPSRLYALQVEGKAPPPRPHYPVCLGAAVLGETSSGALSPSLGEGIAMAFLPPDLQIGDLVEIEVRGRRFPARIIKKPFYKKH